MSDLDDVHRLAALHRMVDDLPKEALDATFRVLESYAKWPPKSHVDAEKLLEQARQRFMQRYEEDARRAGTGLIVGTGGGSWFSPDGYGYSSMRGWEGHTSVNVTVHFFRGHELHVTDRLSLSDNGKKLIYDVETKLADGPLQRHRFDFEVH